MEKIIFLDIDGVLNCQTYFKNHQKERNLFKYISDEGYDYIRILTSIDFYKVKLLAQICDLTGAKVVLISSAFNHNFLFEDYLINLGIPLIDKIDSFDRGEGIRDYLENHHVDKFIIFDDEIARDYNELENYIIKTDFFNEGLTDEHSKEAIKVLGLKY